MIEGLLRNCPSASKVVHSGLMSQHYPASLGILVESEIFFQFLFVIYDVIMFIPTKLFSNPKKVLEKTWKIKVDRI